MLCDMTLTLDPVSNEGVSLHSLASCPIFLQIPRVSYALLYMVWLVCINYSSLTVLHIFSSIPITGGISCASSAIFASAFATLVLPRTLLCCEFRASFSKTSSFYILVLSEIVPLHVASIII